MVYLEESNFKNYLRNNAKGDWFVKGKTYKHSDILKSDGSSQYSNLPLVGTKVKDFEDFKEASLLIKSKSHLTKEGLEKIILIKSRMNFNRG